MSGPAGGAHRRGIQSAAPERLQPTCAVRSVGCAAGGAALLHARRPAALAACSPPVARPLPPTPWHAMQPPQCPASAAPAGARARRHARAAGRAGRAAGGAASGARRAAAARRRGRGDSGRVGPGGAPAGPRPARRARAAGGRSAQHGGARLLPGAGALRGGAGPHSSWLRLPGSQRARGAARGLSVCALAASCAWSRLKRGDAMVCSEVCVALGVPRAQPLHAPRLLLHPSADMGGQPPLCLAPRRSSRRSGRCSGCCRRPGARSRRTRRARRRRPTGWPGWRRRWSGAPPARAWSRTTGPARCSRRGAAEPSRSAPHGRHALHNPAGSGLCPPWVLLTRALRKAERS